MLPPATGSLSSESPGSAPLTTPEGACPRGRFYRIEAAATLTKGDPPRSLGDDTKGVPHARRQDGGSGATHVHPAADFPRGDPHVETRRADPRTGPAPGAGLQEAQHELSGHRHGPP